MSALASMDKKCGDTYRCTKAVDIFGCHCSLFEIWDEFVQEFHGYVTTPTAGVTVTLRVLMRKSHAFVDQIT
jgi:hypothetical protein